MACAAYAPNLWLATPEEQAVPPILPGCHTAGPRLGPGRDPPGLEDFPLECDLCRDRGEEDLDIDPLPGAAGPRAPPSEDELVAGTGNSAPMNTSGLGIAPLVLLLKV